MGPQGQRQFAVKYTRESEGYANEWWQINPEIVKQVCANFDETLFESLLKAYCKPASMRGLLPKAQVGTWQLISVNVNRETSADVAMIVERSLQPECARTPARNFCRAGVEIVGHAEFEGAWLRVLW